MNQFQISWNDLSFEKQQDILETVKEYEKDKLKEEWKEKKLDIGFEDFMMGFYEICWKFDKKEEKEKFFDLELEEFLEELAMVRINKGFKHLSVEL